MARAHVQELASACLRPAALAVGLPKTCRPYDLRHSLAALLYAEGRNPAEIAKIMGHSVETLSSTYTHVIEELEGAGRQNPPSSSHRPVEPVVTYWSHKF